MKRALVIVALSGLVVTSFATTSRILSMGKHDAFFMDETSVFRNPANVNVYPNMIMGSYGEYRILVEDTAGNADQYSALSRTSQRDPREGFFGAILTYSFKGAEQENAQYPMLSMGAVFNRRDVLMDFVEGTTDQMRALYGEKAKLVDLADPVGKADVMVGYSLANGGKLGVGAYFAGQKENASNRECAVIRANLGMNWPVGRTIDLEVSGGLGIVNARDTALVRDSVLGYDVGDTVILADNDLTIVGDIRLFSAMSAINGDFVPHVGVKWSQLLGGDRIMLDINAGVGLNVNIDKGFFWAGVEGIYEQRDFLDQSFSSSGIGAKVSFGIERNVVWDWFVVRVGGQKKVLYVIEGENNGHWQENAEHDSDDDLLGLGIGLNVENRLKFDILVAEDVVYTLTNLFSGPQHHVFTRIDATFSF